MNDKIVGRPIRCNKQKLVCKTGKDYAEVLFIGDVHWGSPQCDKPRFLAMIDYALKNRLYVFLMGDLIEMATRHSVGGGVYEQEFAGQLKSSKWLIFSNHWPTRNSFSVLTMEITVTESTSFLVSMLRKQWPENSVFLISVTPVGVSLRLVTSRTTSTLFTAELVLALMAQRCCPLNAFPPRSTLTL